MYKTKVIHSGNERWLSTSQQLYKWSWKSDGHVFKRKYLDTVLTFRGSDYEWIKGIENLGDCYEILVEIYKGNDKVYDGYFGCNTGTWNNYECYCEIKVLPNDEYRCILDNLNTKVNILQEVAPINVDIDIVDIQYEYMNFDRWYDNNYYNYFSQSLNCGAWDSVTYNQRPEPFPDYVSADPYLYNEIINYNWSWYRTEALAYTQQGDLWNLQTTLIRQYIYTFDDSYGNPVAPSGTGWNQDVSFIHLGRAATKWVKAVYDHYLTPNFYTSGDIVIIQNLGCGNCNHTYLLNENNYTIDNARMVSNIIDNLAGSCVDGITSDFFFGTNNYVTGQPNKLSSLCFVQNTDLKYITSDEPATVGEMSLGYVLEILDLIFNVKWFIDYRYDALTGGYSKRLRLEHITWFFDKPNIYNLVTKENGKYLGALYTYLDETIPKIETWKTSFYVSMDFAPNYIEYTGSCRNGEDVEYMADITLDVGNITNSTNGEDNGWSLIATQTTENNNIVINEVGLRSGNLTTNGHLSWSNLLYNYHRSYRYLRDGVLNNQVYSFTYLRPDRIQEVLLTECNETLDAMGKVLTDIGWGWIREATKEDNNLKLTLEYGKDI